MIERPLIHLLQITLLTNYFVGPFFGVDGLEVGNAETSRSIFNLAWLGATSFVAK